MKVGFFVAGNIIYCRKKSLSSPKKVCNITCLSFIVFIVHCRHEICNEKGRAFATLFNKIKLTRSVSIARDLSCIDKRGEYDQYNFSHAKVLWRLKMIGMKSVG